MPVLFGAIVGSFIRWALTLGAVWLVEHGVWAKGDAEGWVAGLTVALVALLWSLWAKYKDHVKFLALLSPEEKS